MQGISALPRRSAVRVQASSADAAPLVAAATPVPSEGSFMGISNFTWKKIIPLGIMFFW